MERAKGSSAERTVPNGKATRSPIKKTARTPKAKQLRCRHCGSDDLAPSFIKRRDRRCRKCFSQRYGSATRDKKIKAKS